MEDTELKKLSLYCPKCKQETLVNHQKYEDFHFYSKL